MHYVIKLGSGRSVQGRKTIGIYTVALEDLAPKIQKVPLFLPPPPK